MAGLPNNHNNNTSSRKISQDVDDIKKELLTIERELQELKGEKHVGRFECRRLNECAEKPERNETHPNQVQAMII